MTIKKLSERQKCRDKVQVWFGSKSNHLHPVREAVANAFDEVYNNRREGYIEVVLGENGKDITIYDNGRGIPIHGTTEGVPNYELLFETLFAGTKYDNDDEFTTGTNGCGMTVTQYCSDRFFVKSIIDGKEYFVEYHNGEALIDFDLGGNKTGQKDGTIIQFTLSDEVFDSVDFKMEDIKDLCYRTALVSNGHTKVRFHDVKTKQDFMFEFNSIAEGLNDEVVELITKNYTEKNGDKHKIECVISNKIEEELIQDVYLNATHLVEGGTIHDGIYEATRRYINKYLEQNGLYQAKEKKISKDDIKDSLQFICNYFATRIEFANQTKFSTKSKVYRDMIIEYILENLEILENENPLELEKMAKNILVNKRASEKSSENLAKIKKQLQGKLTIDNRVDGFVDCREHGIKSEVYIAEGRSALGAIVLARNSDYQAAYPLRGKLLNILKTDYKTALANKEIEAFIKLLGCGVEEKIKGTPLFNKEDLRFGKVIIATDQDTDGLHIQCLVLTAIYRLVPSLIRDGHVYILNTPLFEVKDLINDKVHYAYSEAQKDEIVSRLEKYQINRNKGLGELDPETMSTCINKDSQTKIQVTWEDAEKIAYWFDVLMGDKAKERKEFVEETLPDYIMNIDNDTFTEDNNEDKKGIIDILKNNIKEYAGYIITDRVLPSVEDGLKPSQLRILWTMYKKKAFNLTKSGNITGEVFKYHPHGNTYPTLVKMTQSDRQNVPYIIGKGNFGQHTSNGLKEAAERYTECKLSDISIDMLEGTKGNAVDFVYNFDKTELIPKNLATKFPSILAFVNTGIALGMASAIPSYNIEELCKATIEYIKNGKKTVLYPDFATGGYIINDEKTFKEICETGRGSVRIRGKVEVAKNSIMITEIPHTTNREAIIDKIITLVKTNKLPEISSVKDLTDLKGLKVEVICKRGTDKELLIEKLYKLTTLEDSFSANMNVLVDGVPKLLGVYNIIDEWCKFRIKCMKGNLSHEIDKLEKELHLLRGLKKVLLDVDLVVDIIRKTPKEKIAQKMELKFDVDPEQTKFVCAMQLININEDYIKSKIVDIDKKEKSLEVLKATLKDEGKLKKLIITQLEETIKKYGSPRKTLLLEKVKEIKIEKAVEMVEDYNVKVIFTKEGYLKKVRLTSAKGENKLKENDEIILDVDTTNTDEIVILCDDMNAHKFKLNEIEDTKMNSFGTFVPNTLKAKPLGAFVISNNKFVLIAYKERFAKVDIEQYVTKTRRSKLKNSLYSKDVVSVLAMDKDTKLSYTTAKGKVKKLDTSELMVKQSRDTQGVKINVKDIIEFVKIP